MTAAQIREFREKLETDRENLNNRRTFHEHYEWLESYWRTRYLGNNFIDQFSSEFEEYYWKRKDINEISYQFAINHPVGGSKNSFNPTISILRATYYLRFFSGALEYEYPATSNEEEIGAEWTKNSFAALLTIVKQIRDNLFHGQKMELSTDQYNRNKQLIEMAVRVTTIILNTLEEAERNTRN